MGKIPEGLKARWLEALESGEYKKARKQLKSSKGFCCLGVLCDIQLPRRKKYEFWNFYSSLGSIDKKMTLPNYCPASYAGLHFNESYYDWQMPLGALNDKSAGFTKAIEYINENL